MSFDSPDYSRRFAPRDGGREGGREGSREGSREGVREVGLPGEGMLGAGEVVLPVSAVNRAISQVLERSFPLAWISGEVSNFTRAASGHWYFSIKDAQAQMRCVMFRGRAQNADFVPREGDRIEVRALVGLYEPRGEVQLNVEAVRRTGQGKLFEAFLRLKAKLQEEGLFDPARRRALPGFVRTVGVVTSLQAAALRDVLATVARRSPQVRVIVYPAPVQGAGAAAKLAAMVDTASRRAEIDVLIVCRGGGSIEDLWSFNEEVLARAIAACAMPVISGVGHETDFTIADFAADMRAPTPTAAAEMIGAPRERWLAELAQRQAQLSRTIERLLERRSQQIDWLARRLVSPTERLARQATHLRQLAARLGLAGARPSRDAQARFTMVRMRFKRVPPTLQPRREVLLRLSRHLERGFVQAHQARHLRLLELSAHVAMLSPQRTLERGYAALLDARTGAALRSPDALDPGRHLTVHLAEGTADLTVAKVQARLDESFR
jgi:exodeoxyribonuclease VII large subunit